MHAYKRYFLVSNSNSNSKETTLVSSKDKLSANLSSLHEVEEERALDYLAFLESQVCKKPVIEVKK